MKRHDFIRHAAQRLRQLLEDSARLIPNRIVEWTMWHSLYRRCVPSRYFVAVGGKAMNLRANYSTSSTKLWGTCL